MRNVEDVVSRVGKQLWSAVQWEGCVQKALELGMTDFVEIGPKPVLGPFVKSIDKSVRVT